MTELRWGIIGPGSIARRFAGDLPRSRTGRLVAVASRDIDKAKAFAEEHRVDGAGGTGAGNGAGATPQAYGDYAALLADPQVDAVYIATPHTGHVEWAIKAAQAGKPVLCEKPIAVDHAGAMAVFEAAREHDVFAMEAYMYRCVPQTERLVELIASGVIGEVRQIEAAFAFGGGGIGAGRAWDPDLAGGGILDVGGYPVSMARLLAGAASGLPYAEPVRVDAAGRVGETGVDEWAVANLTFPGGISAHVLTGVRMGASNVVRIFGSEGAIEVPNPWLPGRDGSGAGITVRRVGHEIEEIAVEVIGLYAAEADAVAEHLADRQAPACDWADSLGTMAVLDTWRAQIGLEYPFERIDADIPTASRQPLTLRSDYTMRYGRIPHVDKQVSRLVMGVDNQVTLSHGSVMFDDFFSRGGNCFDTAYIYGRGQCERVVGQWIHNRGVRDDVVLIGKGAHTPHCDPESITRQLFESLERLRTDHVDIYFMHRDNPDITVGEFVDVLDEHRRAGRIGAYGGSNWSLERIEEANAYAEANQRQPFVALSNNFSLARMLEPVWAGCIAASDDESRTWLERNDFALLPWSSQARGFFTGRAAPDDRSDQELVRSFYSDDNFERLRRARELAERYGVAPTAVALAYVLGQSFPTFPLIGPRTINETVSSFDALTVPLTKEEVAYLDLR